MIGKSGATSLELAAAEQAAGISLYRVGRFWTAIGHLRTSLAILRNVESAGDADATRLEFATMFESQKIIGSDNGSGSTDNDRPAAAPTKPRRLKMASTAVFAPNSTNTIMDVPPPGGWIELGAAVASEKVQRVSMAHPRVFIATVLYIGSAHYQLGEFKGAMVSWFLSVSARAAIHLRSHRIAPLYRCYLLVALLF